MGGVTEDELIEIWSAGVGSGLYEAEVERWVSVSETSQLQAMPQIENGGIAGMSSGWELLQPDCVTGSNQLTDASQPPDLPGKGGGLISN